MQVSFQNKNDQAYEELINKLMVDVFGFSFAKWHAMRLWDERYESYSIIGNDKMLSNISVYKTQLVTNEVTIEAYQIGAVATLKEFRGRGLAAKIMQAIIDKYSAKPMFLFANSTVLDFYPKFGFARISDNVAMVKQTIHNPNVIAEKLTKENLLVHKYLHNGRRLSTLLDTTNTQPIAYFHFIMEFGSDIYLLPKLDTLIVAKQEENVLYILNINAPLGTNFSEIALQLPFVNVDTVQFGFVPDLFNVEYKLQEDRDDGQYMFIKNGTDFPARFVFPALAKT